MKRALAILLLLLPAPALADGVTTYPYIPGAAPVCISPAPYMELMPKVRFTVTADGSVADPVIDDPTGNTDVDQAAAACVRTWKYRPATHDGAPVPMQWTVRVTWDRDPDYVPPRGDSHCYDPLPPNAMDDVTLRYTIDTDGNAKPGAIMHASGNAAFDALARKCVSALQFSPGFYKGKTVTVTRAYTLQGQVTTHTITQVTSQRELPKPSISSPAAIGGPRSCISHYPAEALRLHHEGVTGLTFTINVDGSLSGITVNQPSGFDDLDQAAIECAAHWTYRPATQSGQPVAVPWRAKVTWKLPPAQQETRP